MIDGIPVISSEYVKIGHPLRFADPGMKRLQVFAHPLDAIAMKHVADPLARLDEAMTWIVGRAHRQLDSLAHHLAPEPDVEGSERG
ncbi:hypothetical protein Agsp01_11550 [Agromyces sp. NBRC 114283]|nr:hypothetical protein Agsp01_11550 [Agromyces sp. NBRC 114283]